MVYPIDGGAPEPNEDLPSDIRVDYEEAQKILQLSPRGSAALLRLCIQKLCGELGESPRDLDKAIGRLVKKGLPVEVQQALDAVRVVGNHSVHPGQIDLNDDRDLALVLFDLVNIITERLISQPKRIRETYEKLPESAREAIERRDGTSS